MHLAGGSSSLFLAACRLGLSLAVDMHAVVLCGSCPLFLSDCLGGIPPVDMRAVSLYLRPPPTVPAAGVTPSGAFANNTHSNYVLIAYC